MKPSSAAPEQQVERVQDRRAPAGLVLQVHQRHEQHQRDVGEDAVDAREQQQALGDLARGAQLMRHHHHHRGRRCSADCRGAGGQQRRVIQVHQSRVDRHEGAEALADRGDRQPAVAAEPVEVEAMAELEDDQAEREVDHHAVRPQTAVRAQGRARRGRR
jgi:hypothetical protein